MEMGKILRRHPQGAKTKRKSHSPASGDSDPPPKKPATGARERELSAKMRALEETSEHERSARVLLDIEVESTKSKLSKLEKEHKAARSSIDKLAAALEKATKLPPVEPPTPMPAAAPATLMLQQAMEEISTLRAEHSALKAALTAQQLAPTPTAPPASTFLLPTGPSAVDFQHLASFGMAVASTLQQPTTHPWMTMPQRAQSTFQLQPAAYSPWFTPNVQLRPHGSFAGGNFRQKQL